MHPDRGTLNDRTADLEQQYRRSAALARQDVSRAAAGAHQRLIRLAKTCKDKPEDDEEEGTYPDPPANTFSMLLIDATYDQESGDQDVTPTSRSAQPLFVVRNVADYYIPEGTFIWVFQQQGRWYTWWKLGEPLLGYLPGDTPLAEGNAHDFNLIDSDQNPILDDEGHQVTLPVLAFQDLVEPEVINLIFFDPNQTQFYAIPISAHQPRTGVSGSSSPGGGGVVLAAGAAGTMELFDVKGNDQSFTLPNVWALNSILNNEQVLLFYDYWQFQWYGMSINKPVIGKVTVALPANDGGNAGTIVLYDSTKTITTTTLANKVRSPFSALPPGTWVLVFWDFVAKQFWCIPASTPGPLLAKNDYSGAGNKAANATFTANLYDDQWNALGVQQTGVRALAAIVKNEPVILFYDQNQNEFYATPFNRPMIGQVSSGGDKGVPVTVELYDSDDNDQSNSINATPVGGPVPDNAYVLVWFDWIEQDYFCIPIPTTSVTVLTAVQWDSSDHKLQYKTRPIVAITDGDESPWTDIVTFDPCVCSD